MRGWCPKDPNQREFNENSVPAKGLLQHQRDTQPTCRAQVQLLELRDEPPPGTRKTEKVKMAALSVVFFWFRWRSKQKKKASFMSLNFRTGNQL
jgi:hypothetical protein